MLFGHKNIGFVSGQPEMVTGTRAQGRKGKGIPLPVPCLFREIGLYRVVPLRQVDESAPPAGTGVVKPRAAGAGYLRTSMFFERTTLLQPFVTVSTAR